MSVVSSSAIVSVPVEDISRRVQVRRISCWMMVDLRKKMKTITEESYSFHVDVNMLPKYALSLV